MEQLLITKFYIPTRRPDLVLRSRLIERLNQGLHHKLTIISAPAGFGKTTLVGEWVHSLRFGAEDSGTTCDRIAWLSLDASDNDLVRFLAYLIAAMDHSLENEAALGKRLQGMLQSPQPPPPETVLTTLINDLAAFPGRMVLCLDDYHLIEDPAIHEALTFFIEHLPPSVHLVIATREDPHLPLARLRAREQLTELRAADLRFKLSEAAEFLKQVMGLDLSAEDISALETRTEGWIAGLQLAAISMRGHKDASHFITSFTGSHRLILDYLIEEVLEQQTESIQAFLLQTSILDKLSGSLCDALNGQVNSQEILELLEHSNLFIIPLDSDRRWYRYHHLFTELLHQRLRQTQPENLLELQCRASEWYEQHGLMDEAIVHALRAEDFERAVQLIDNVAETVWGRGEGAKLQRWLVGLPEELVCSRPQLGVFRAWNLLGNGRLEEAEQVLQAAERAIEPGAEQLGHSMLQETIRPQGLTVLQLRGRIATTRAFSAFYRGDVSAITQHARLALEALPEHDESWRSTTINVLGDAYDLNGEMEEAYHARLEAVESSRATGNSLQIMITNLKLAIILRHMGQLQRTIQICKQQRQFAQESGMAETAVAGWLGAIWGEVLAETNDLEGAVREAKNGVEQIKRGGDLAMLGWSYLCLSRVLFSCGDLTRAAEVLEMLEYTAQGKFVPPWIMNLKAAWLARIWLSRGELETAAQWVRDRGLEAGDELAYQGELEHTVLARILIAQERLEEANNLLERLLVATEAGGRGSRMIEILNLQALTLQDMGDQEQSLNTLERALGIAAPAGFVRIFVDEGPPMARLLYEALGRDTDPIYVRRLLAAFPAPETEPMGRSKTPSAETGLFESLSEREIEVLQHVAGGQTNREIAAELYLSLNTVKVHTRNIYGKLGVHSRTQAVLKARTMGILVSH